MSGLVFHSAGESHGPQLTGILEGLPAGMTVDFARINADLAERQRGFGRGGRMTVESDRCVITAGVRHGVTLGSPIAFYITNKDWDNWQAVMSVTDVESAPSSEHEADLLRPRTVPRPGHADLAGAQKYDFADLRNVLERASARETAVRVAAGAFARMLLSEFGVGMAAHVVRIGGAAMPAKAWTVEEVRAGVAGSDVRCLDPEVSEAMRAEIRAAAAAGNTVGGVVEVVASGLVPGLGDYVQWDRRLDGLLAQALMSVPSVKGVEIGDGFAQTSHRGSEVHDEIHHDRANTTRQSGFYRLTNRAGGLEGGVTNGADLVVRAATKPLPTLNQPLGSVDIHTKEATRAFVERSDICSVPAAAVVCEAMVALVLADAYLQAFGGGALSDIRDRFAAYVSRLDQFGAAKAP